MRISDWSSDVCSSDLRSRRRDAFYLCCRLAGGSDGNATLARPAEAGGVVRRRAMQGCFWGLLPEEGQRTAIARALGVSPDNPFRLLAALGGDVAGALAFLPEGEPPPVAPHGEPAHPLAQGSAT